MNFSDLAIGTIVILNTNLDMVLWLQVQSDLVAYDWAHYNTGFKLYFCSLLNPLK